MTSTLTATLMAVTPEAQSALGNRLDVRIGQFPFKIGREGRSPSPLARLADIIERRLGAAPESNDLYLLESPFSAEHQISPAHCSIELVGGEFFLVDRGSVCGSTVVAAR